MEWNYFSHYIGIIEITQGRYSTGFWVIGIIPMESIQHSPTYEEINPTVFGGIVESQLWYEICIVCADVCRFQHPNRVHRCSRNGIAFKYTGAKSQLICIRYAGVLHRWLTEWMILYTYMVFKRIYVVNGSSTNDDNNIIHVNSVTV